MSKFRVNKGRSAGKFRSRASKTNRINMIARGGFRL